MSEQRKTSIVLLADSPAIPIRVIAPALLTAPALHQCPYLKPSLGDLAAQMELRFETPPFHFSWTRAAVVLPIASSKECIWCFVVGTIDTLSLQHRMKCSSRGTNFFAPKNGASRQICRRFSVSPGGQCNLLYDRTKINQTFPLDPSSLIGHRLHQQKCSRKKRNIFTFLVSFVLSKQQ